MLCPETIYIIDITKPADEKLQMLHSSKFTAPIKGKKSLLSLSGCGKKKKPNQVCIWQLDATTLRIINIDLGEGE